MDNELNHFLFLYSYIINIITKDELVVNRFNKKKYDPLNDKIYSDYELSQEIITKDKKLMERL